MKVFRHKETGQTIIEVNPNHYSIYAREGYEEVKEDKPKRKKKKE